MPIDVIPIPEFVKNLPGRNSSATHELVFLANHLPPLGSKSYYIEVANEFGTMELKAEMNGRFIENQVGQSNIILKAFSLVNRIIVIILFKAC